MKYIDAEKLNAEIERLYDGKAPKHDQQCNFDDGYFTGIGVISAFLDTLSEEPDKSLEEAAEEQAKSLGYMSQDVEFKENVESFIAGWKCRDDQMPMPEDTVLFNKGVAEGRRLEREDMMKDGNVILAEEDFDAEKEKSMEWGYNLCKEQMLKDSVTVECYVRVYPTLDDKPRPWVALYKNGIGCNSLRDIPELENIGFKDNDTAIVIIKRKGNGQ